MFFDNYPKDVVVFQEKQIDWIFLTSNTEKIPVFERGAFETIFDCFRGDQQLVSHQTVLSSNAEARISLISWLSVFFADIEKIPFPVLQAEKL